MDEGLYSVIAESAAGEASCSANIDVYDLEPVSVGDRKTQFFSVEILSHYFLIAGGLKLPY